MKRMMMVCLACLLLPLWGQAAGMLFPTFTDGVGGQDTMTLDAYLPLAAIPLEAVTPEDFCLVPEEEAFLVADTGRGRVLLVDMTGALIREIGAGELRSPGGLAWVGGRVYVADSGLMEILVYDLMGVLQLRITRPETPSFGRSTGFVPRKITTDLRGNIYVVTDNSPNGVLQFSHNGQYAGFHGANAAQLGWVTTLQRLLYTDAQKAQLLQVLPPSPTNAVITPEGLLVTVTNGVDPGVKKFATSGMLLLEPEFHSTGMLDVCVDPDGNITGIDAQGYVHITDAQGDRVFTFGTRSEHFEVRGATRSPVAIDKDDKGILYILDRETAAISRYAPTEFGAMVMEAVKAYSAGLYVQSEAQWQEISRKNSVFLLGHRALAQAAFKQDRFEEALAEFQKGGDRRGYSDAFWYIRNQWLQSKLSYVLLAGIVLVVLLKLLARTPLWKRMTGRLRSLSRFRLVREVVFAAHFIRHPLDGVYDIKRHKRGDVAGATVFFGLYLAALVFQREGTAYLFKSYAPQSLQLLLYLLANLLPFALGIVSSYLVSAINDGEATLPQVYTVVGYALVPLIMSLPLMTLLSHVLTRNEAFLYRTGLLAGQVWTAFLLLAGLKEAYAYRVGGILKNLVLTAFTMTSALVICAVVLMLATQEWAFAQTLWNEVMMRVQF